MRKASKQIIAIFLCLITVFCVACTPNGSGGANVPPENGKQKIIETTKTINYALENTDTLSFAYYEGSPEILLIEFETAISYFYGQLMPHFVDAETFDYAETNTTITMDRGNGSKCELDFVDDTIYFSDFDLFLSKTFDISPMDLLATNYLDEDGNKIYFDRISAFNAPGYPYLIDLASRNIPLDIYNGKKYIPFQTFNDLFISAYGVDFWYNGDEIFFAPGGSISNDLMSKYYSVPAKEKSTALANYTFNELTLLLDVFYGLQKEHEVDNGFAHYLYRTGLYEDLLSVDAAKTFNAMGTLTLGYMADMHSAIKMASPYVGAPRPSEITSNVAVTINQYQKQEDKFSEAREKAMPDGVPAYQEVGNTAFVTFDVFEMGNRSVGYDQAGELSDTFEIVIQAHKMITRENSPIENVVLDLSNNGGGSADAAVYVVAWMLGFCDINFTNPISKYQASITYTADVNLDGQFDESDSISDKNLFCLISPVSFSCGNYVPALLKASNEVTIVGQKSSGGACVVKNACLADGTVFQISGNQHLSVPINGAYYSVDEGIEPHFTLSKVDSFYNREMLVEYFNGLL